MSKSVKLDLNEIKTLERFLERTMSLIHHLPSVPSLWLTKDEKSENSYIINSYRYSDHDFSYIKDKMRPVLLTGSLKDGMKLEDVIEILRKYPKIRHHVDKLSTDFNLWRNRRLLSDMFASSKISGTKFDLSLMLDDKNIANWSGDISKLMVDFQVANTFLYAKYWHANEKTENQWRKLSKFEQELAKRTTHELLQSAIKLIVKAQIMIYEVNAVEGLDKSKVIRNKADIATDSITSTLKKKLFCVYTQSITIDSLNEIIWIIEPKLNSSKKSKLLGIMPKLVDASGTYRNVYFYCNNGRIKKRQNKLVISSGGSPISHVVVFDPHTLTDGRREVRIDHI